MRFQNYWLWKCKSFVIFHRVSWGFRYWFRVYNTSEFRKAKVQKLVKVFSMLRYPAKVLSLSPTILFDSSSALQTLTWFVLSFLFLVRVPFPALRKLDMLFGRWKSGLLWPALDCGAPKLPKILRPADKFDVDWRRSLDEFILFDSLLLTASLLALLDFKLGLKACFMLPTRFILTLCCATADKPKIKNWA